ncbi:aminoglycoside phosphotransferase [Clostridium acetobutylicum]|nr:aminoglycoside phosphotransferase [Clostridium acetobutylicum]
MDFLYEFNNKKISSEDFKLSFKKLGIKEGDVVFLHSDITVFGKLILTDRKKFFNDILSSVKDVVGKKGVVIMPAFSYSFCNGEVFDVKKTKGTVGALNEFFRKSEDTVRTVQPIFSCSVWGERKNEFLNISLDSFGENSIFDKLFKSNGKLLFLGADFHSCTYLHYIEQSFGIPYRYLKIFKGKIKDGENEYLSECKFYVRYLDKNVVLETERLKKHLLEEKIMSETLVGDGSILSVDARKLYDEVFKMLKKDIFYLLREPVEI